MLLGACLLLLPCCDSGTDSDDADADGTDLESVEIEEDILEELVEDIDEDEVETDGTISVCTAAEDPDEWCDEHFRYLGGFCEGMSRCDEEDGTCYHETPRSCDDDDRCTEDWCEEEGEEGECKHHTPPDYDEDGYRAKICGSGGDDCCDFGNEWDFHGCSEETKHLIHPGAEELCNGIDDNCNEKTDEEVFGPLEEAPVRVTHNPAGSEYPSMVWTGSEFGMAWHDNRDGQFNIYFARLNRDGNKIGEDVRVNSSGFKSLDARLVWAGSQFGIVWSETLEGTPPECHFNTISAEGVPGDHAFKVSIFGLALNPVRALCSIFWTESHFGVPYITIDGLSFIIMLARIAPDGTRLGEDFQITSESRLYFFPFGVYAGGFYELVWMDATNVEEQRGNIWYAKVTDAGEIEDGPRQLNESVKTCEYPVIVDMGEWGRLVAWADNRTGTNQVIYKIVHADGSLSGEKDIPPGFSGAQYPVSSTWNDAGEEVGIVWWEGSKDPPTSESRIYLQRIFRDGALIGDPIDITAGYSINGNNEPAVAFNGSDYGIAWVHFVDSNNEIFFRRFGCL